MKRLLLLPLATLLASSNPSALALDDVGDMAMNFTLTNHITGSPLHLTDYAGSVILIDFFAWWCPFCNAQSPQIESGINQFYRDNGGNPHGVPVTVLTISFDGSNPSRTDQLIHNFGLEIVADDFTGLTSQQFGRSGQPYYVIINGVTNSPNHQPWEVLYRQSSYGATLAPTNQLRAVIDTVQAAPAPPPVVSDPAIQPNGTFQLTIPAQAGQTNRVEYSTNLTDWLTLTNITEAEGPVTVTDPHPLEGRRFYRLARP